MAARLTKRNRRWQGAALAAALLLAGSANGEPRPGEQALRDCIADARGAGAVMACEKSQQVVLKDRIKRWSAGIRQHLDARQLAAFDRNSKAWKAFFDSEIAMLDLTLAARRDGLGPTLRPGAVTRLYEERERQLREHLHNLSYVGRKSPPTR